MPSKRRPRRRVTVARADQRRREARELVAYEIGLREQVNRALNATLSQNGGQEYFDSPAYKILNQRTKIDALVDVLAEKGVIDKQQFNIARYKHLLKALRPLEYTENTEKEVESCASE